MLRSMIVLFYHIWIFMKLLYITTPYHLSDIDNDHIELTQLISNDNQIRIRCDAKSRNTVESLILLSCPLSKTGVCRENCINPCPVNETSTICNDAVTLAIPKCIYRSMSNDHIQIEYLIHLNAINEKGQWWCTFRGKRSNSIELDSYHIQQKLTTTNMKTVNTYDTVIDITTPIDISPNLIQLIIGLVGVSIAFNIFFFVRCFTVKNYLKNIHIGHSRNNCLDQLLCIDQPRKLSPKTRLNYIQHVSPSETPKLTVKLSTTVTTTISTTNEQWTEPINLMTMTHDNHSPFVYHKSNSIPSSPTTNYPILHQNPLQYTQQYSGLPQNSFYSKYPMHNSFINPNPNNNGSSMEFIYDEVHNSIYTTTNSQPSDHEKRKDTTKFQKFPNNTVRTVYDIGDWLVDKSGQIYIPYAQITPKPQRIILNNFDYSTLRKNDFFKNSPLLNTIINNQQQQQQHQQERQQQHQQEQQQQHQQEQQQHHQQEQKQQQQPYSSTIPIQTRDPNSINNNNNNNPMISSTLSLPLVPVNITKDVSFTNEQLFIQNIPIEVNELDNVIEQNSNLQNSNSSINKNNKQSINQIDLFNPQVSDSLNTHKNIDQKFITNNINKSTEWRPSIKLLSHKTTKQLNGNSTHKINENHKIADLEDWSMIDQD
ncbi:unnamed protein product [Schistosoma guineensis]|nr:unnamed protein product [Schistosoma guineensis]